MCVELYYVCRRHCSFDCRLTAQVEGERSRVRSECILIGRLGKLSKHLFDRKQNLLTNCGRTGNRLKLNKSKQLGCQIKLNQLAVLHYEAGTMREIGKGREEGREEERSLKSAL